MRTDTITTSQTSHLVSHDTTNYSYDSIANGYPLSNAYNDTTNTNQARINCTKGQNAETWVYFIFDLSIPSGATINSISCKARAGINTTSSGRFSAYNVQLYAGSTGKGSAVSLSNTIGTKTFTSAQIGSWTVSELNSARLRIYAKRGTSNTSNTYYLMISGAELTVNYTYNQVVYEVTSYSEVSGVSMSPSSADINAGSGRTFEILGDLTNVVVEDNSVDVTSQLVSQTGGSVSATYSLSNVNEDHFIHFYLRGNKIFIKVNGTWKEASDVKVKVNGSWQSISKAYKKVSGAWVEQSDKSAMFDPNALYLKG